MANSTKPIRQQAKAPPPQKYELPEKDLKAGLFRRFSVVLLLSGAFVLLKDVLFNWGPKSWGESGIARAEGVEQNDPENGNVEPPSLVVVETPESIDQAAAVPKLDPSPKFNSASSSGTSIDSFLAVEQPIFAPPVQARLSSGLPVAAMNDNEPARPIVGSDANELGLQVGGGVSGSGGGSGRGAIDATTPATDADTATSDPRLTGNRAPIVTGPARMNHLMIAQTMIIAAASLLESASDADGDVLSIQNLVASSGNLVDNGDGTWSYTPDPNDMTEVTLTYDVTDGTESTPQTAVLDLRRLPDATMEGTDAPNTIIGTPSHDVIAAGAGDDTVMARGGSDVIYGGDGDDRILAGEGDDVIYGGAGNDAIFAGGGDDWVYAGDGDDTVFGGDGNDFILGENGNDLIFGGAGDDTIDGGDGNDQFIATVSDGNDTYAGGTGNDTYDLSETEAGATVNLALGTASSSQTGNDRLSDIENVIGGAGHDVITGSDADNVIQGGQGSDQIDGGAGADTFVATIADGDDTYVGGGGLDTYDLSGITAGVVVDLALGTAQGAEIGSDSLSGIEDVIGGAADDTIVGSDADNVIQGGQGSDLIDGGAGADTFVATIADGNDTFIGGGGLDTYDLSGTTAGVVVDLAQGTANGAEIGTDSLSSIENVVGGSGDDVFRANDSFNVFTGGEGNDIFAFGSGTLDSDTVREMRDQITDFQVGDKIDLSKFDTNWMLVNEPDIDLVVDKLEFSDSGQLKFRFEGFGDNELTIVEGKIDETGEFSVAIELVGRHDLTVDDFIGVS